MNNSSSVNGISDDEQRRLARTYLWQTVFRQMTFLWLVIPLGMWWMLRSSVAIASTIFFAWLVAALIAIGVAVLQVRRQLAAFNLSGVGLSRDLLSAAPQREFVSALDPISSVNVCADVLSSVGTARALCYRSTAAFRCDWFKGVIRLGPQHPFWLFGSIEVRVVETSGRATRVIVRNKPGITGLMLQKGEALRTVETVVTHLQTALQQRRHALDAVKREQELERAALQAKLTALQAQVEPHFLFNTMANLKYLIRTDADRAQLMVDHLVGYLQTALPDMRSASSTVRREVALAEHYLSIMQIRMGDHLHFRCDIAEEALDVPVPPSMLISLLENAIKHGLERATRPGEISISAHIENRHVILVVSDNGTGLADEVGQGFGLANIHQRLKLLYADAASMLVAPGIDGGVAVTLSIPLPDSWN